MQCMWIQAWVVAKDRMGRVLEISGTRKNITIAEYVHDTLCRYIDSAWDAYRRGKGLNRYRKTDFAVGIIQGFTTTLQKGVHIGSPQQQRRSARSHRGPRPDPLCCPAISPCPVLSETGYRIRRPGAGGRNGKREKTDYRKRHCPKRRIQGPGDWNTKNKDYGLGNLGRYEKEINGGR